MLQAIRDRAQGWIAWAIVILISIPFALWGIQEYIGVGSAPVVASVNATEITEQELNRSYQQFRQNLRERMGKSYRPELFDDANLRKQVLDDMIRKELIRQQSEKLGLNAGDQLVRTAILAVPQFQKGGRFDQATYEQVLGYQGLNPTAFEHRTRASLISNQLSQALSLSEFVTQHELESRFRLREQKRKISYFVVPIEELTTSDPVSDAAVKTYYDAQQMLFRMPEQIKVEYLDLDAEHIAATVNPDEETLQGYYAARRDDFGEAEQRQASHILITVAADADEATVQAAREKIEEALARISEGEEFSEVAKQISDDSVSAEAGGDLGFFEKGIMDPAFENVAFEAQVGDLVGPIRSRFGFHIIKVTDIQAARYPSFEEKREELLADYRSNEGQRMFYDYAERLGDLAYENPDSLTPAAEALGIEINVSDWMGRQGGPGVLASPKIVSAAFSEDVLLQGNNSDTIELGPERMLVLRVAEHQEAFIKPLVEVKEQIIGILRRQDAAQRAKEKGQTLLQRLESGEALEAIAADTGYPLKTVDALDRENRELQGRLVDYVFGLAKPEGEKPTLGSFVLPNQDFAIVGLYDVIEGSVSSFDDKLVKKEEGELRQSLARTTFNHLVQQMRDTAEVKIR